MNIAERPQELMTSAAAYKVAEKKRIVSEFQELKRYYESQGVITSNQSIINLLAGRYHKNDSTIRRTLQAAEII